MYIYRSIFIIIYGGCFHARTAQNLCDCTANILAVSWGPFCIHFAGPDLLLGGHACECGPSRVGVGVSAAGRSAVFVSRLNKVSAVTKQLLSAPLATSASCPSSTFIKHVGSEGRLSYLFEVRTNKYMIL